MKCKFVILFAKLVILQFIIHPCDPTVVICYLIRPCDIAIRITYLISHNSSLSCNTVIKGYFSPTDSYIQGTSCKNLMMHGGLYQHTRVVLYIYNLFFWYIKYTHIHTPTHTHIHTHTHKDCKISKVLRNFKTMCHKIFWSFPTY